MQLLVSTPPPAIEFFRSCDRKCICERVVKKHLKNIVIVPTAKISGALAEFKMRNENTEDQFFIRAASDRGFYENVPGVKAVERPPDSHLLPFRGKECCVFLFKPALACSEFKDTSVRVRTFVVPSH